MKFVTSNAKSGWVHQHWGNCFLSHRALIRSWLMLMAWSWFMSAPHPLSPSELVVHFTWRETPHAVESYHSHQQINSWPLWNARLWVTRQQWYKAFVVERFCSSTLLFILRWFKIRTSDFVRTNYKPVFWKVSVNKVALHVFLDDSPPFLALIYSGIKMTW